MSVLLGNRNIMKTIKYDEIGDINEMGKMNVKYCLINWIN